MAGHHARRGRGTQGRVGTRSKSMVLTGAKASKRSSRWSRAWAFLGRLRGRPRRPARQQGRHPLSWLIRDPLLLHAVNDAHPSARLHVPDELLVRS